MEKGEVTKQNSKICPKIERKRGKKKEKKRKREKEIERDREFLFHDKIS